MDEKLELLKIRSTKELSDMAHNSEGHFNMVKMEMLHTPSGMWQAQENQICELPCKLPETEVSNGEKTLDHFERYPQLGTCTFTIKSNSKLLLDYENDEWYLLCEGEVYPMKNMM